jgi:hypothetical protein
MPQDEFKLLFDQQRRINRTAFRSMTDERMNALTHQTVRAELEKGQDRFVDAPELCHGLSKLCRAVVNSERLHDRGGLDKFEGTSKPEQVIPVFLNELGVDAMAGNATQQTVIG